MHIILYDQDEDYEIDKIDLSMYDLSTDGDTLLALIGDIIDVYVEEQE